MAGAASVGTQQVIVMVRSTPWPTRSTAWASRLAAKPARVARALGMPTRPDTVLRLLKRGAAAPLPSEPVRVLGIDDWAWRRGRRYGTILVDGERHRILDLLPDRTAAPLIAWLQAHPEIEYVTRDRATAYGEAIRRSAPQAIQVADRFHLLQNLVDALQRAVARHSPALRAAACTVQQRHTAPAAAAQSASPNGLSTEAPAAGPGPAMHPLRFRRRRPPGATQQEQRAAATAARRQQRLANYTTVCELHARGMPQFTIHRVLDLSRPCVRKYVTNPVFPERARPPVASGGRPVCARAARHGHHQPAGPLGAAARLGLCGVEDDRLAMVRRAAPRTRTPAAAPIGAPPAWQAHPAAQAAAAVLRHSTRTDQLLGHSGNQVLRPPGPRATTWLLLKSAAELESDERAYIEALYQQVPELAAAQQQAVEFRRVVRERDRPGFEVGTPPPSRIRRGRSTPLRVGWRGIWRRCGQRSNGPGAMA